MHTGTRASPGIVERQNHVRVGRRRTAGRRFSRGRRSGFTLLEMLLVVALISVVVSLFLVSFESLARSTPAEELEAAFWKTMAKARTQALALRRPVEVRYDKDAGKFLLRIDQPVGEVAVPRSAFPAHTDIDIVFTEDLPANDFILVRGDLVTRRPVTAVKVFPDGTCQSFAVEFQVGKSVHLVVVDPWTGAEMLTTGAANTKRS